MGYEQSLLMAWGINNSNFEYIEESWHKPSLIMTIYRFITRKTKK